MLHIIHQIRFQGYRCESSIAILALRITWNYAYIPFRLAMEFSQIGTKTKKIMKFCVLQGVPQNMTVSEKFTTVFK